MEGAGWIGRHKLHIHSPASALVTAAECRPLTENPREDVGDGFARQPEIDEPGASDLDARDDIGRDIESLDDFFRQLPGRALQRFGELQRHVRGEIAVPRLTGAIQRHLQGARFELLEDLLKRSTQPCFSGGQEASPVVFLSLLGRLSFLEDASPLPSFFPLSFWGSPDFFL